MARTLPLAAALAFCVAPASVVAQDPAGKIDLAVLYAGVLESPRTADFKEFLEARFTKVGLVELAALDAKAAAGSDVVIVDSPSPFKGADRFEMPKTPKLGLDFDKPVVLMGAAGGNVVSRLEIKLDWL
jgi:hypothetical protein